MRRANRAGGRQRNRRRQAFGHFLGKARAGQRAAQRASAELGDDDLMRQLRRFRLKSLAHPEQRPDQPACAQSAKRRAQTESGVARINSSASATELAKSLPMARASGNGKPGRKWRFSRVSRIFAIEIGLRVPQRHLMPGGKGDGQRRSPRAGGNHRGSFKPSGLLGK